MDDLNQNGQAPPRTLLPYVDRTGSPLALGDKVLFLPNTMMPMVMELVEVAPILDPQAPPGAQRLLFTMTTAIMGQPGGQVPGFLVGVDQAPSAPPPAPSPIIFPSGGH